MNLAFTNNPNRVSKWTAENISDHDATIMPASKTEKQSELNLTWWRETEASNLHDKVNQTILCFSKYLQQHLNLFLFRVSKNREGVKTKLDFKVKVLVFGSSTPSCDIFITQRKLHYVLFVTGVKEKLSAEILYDFRDVA